MEEIWEYFVLSRKCSASGSTFSLGGSLNLFYVHLTRNFIHFIFASTHTNVYLKAYHLSVYLRQISTKGLHILKKLKHVKYNRIIRMQLILQCNSKQSSDT